jgi:preprotein translocase subunit YajC
MTTVQFVLPVLRVLLPQEPQSPTGPTPRTETGAGTTAPADPNAGVPPGPGAKPAQCGYETFLMMGLFLALMWFLVLRPEGKRRKESAAMLSSLKQGDNVVTIGGMHGQVAAIQEKTVVLRIGDQRMTFDRSAIARVVRDEPPKDQKN